MLTRSKHTRSGGYVLLMTVLLLAVTAVALSALGRRSFRHAMTALQAEEDLQRRWAVLSCERVLLPRAAGLVDYQANETTAALAAAEPEPIKRLVLWLGGDSGDGSGVTSGGGALRVSLVFADEQAKLNVPALLARTDRPTAEGVIGTLLHGRGLSPPVRLEPFDLEPTTDSEDGDEYRWPLIASFDQVLVDADPDALVGKLSDASPANMGSRSYQNGVAPEGDGGIVDGLTLWGDGKVNIRVARMDVLRAALSPDLGFAQVFRIVELRRDRPDAGLNDILSQLELSDQQRQRMEQRLTDSSDTHSLWIVVSNGDRRWHHMAVQTPVPGSASESGLMRVERLIW